MLILRSCCFTSAFSVDGSYSSSSSGVVKRNYNGATHKLCNAMSGCIRKVHTYLMTASLWAGHSIPAMVLPLPHLAPIIHQACVYFDYHGT